MKTLMAVIMGFNLFFAQAVQSAPTSDIRLYNDFKLPLEPSTLFSMSEYNLSLCLFSTIFEMGDAGVPESPLLESWVYNREKSSYEFIIKKGIVWSDGVPLKAEDLKNSIIRLRKVASSHYKSIMSLVMVRDSNPDKNLDDGLEIVDDRHLRIYVHKPSPDLFARLTGVFIPIIRTDLLDSKTQRVARHNVSLGPYVVDEKATDAGNLILRKNELYYLASEDMAKSIHMKPYLDLNPRAEDILQPNAWPNLILDRAFTPKVAWDNLRKNKISIWTRPVDRILYMYPTKHGLQRDDLFQVTRWMGSKLEQSPIDFSAFPGIKVAKSLQPKGFFLYDPIKYKSERIGSFTKPFKVAIANTQIPADFLVSEFKKRGLLITFEQFPVAKMKELHENDRFDFIIGSFGAADPDPVTWLSLVLGNEMPFIADYDRSLRHEFEDIKKDLDDKSRYSRLKSLIYEAGIKGLYLPLAHFSSIAVASPHLDLSMISEADETVSLSRVKVKDIKK